MTIEIGTKIKGEDYDSTILEYIENYKGYGPVYVLQRDDGIIYRLQSGAVKSKIRAQETL